LFEQAGEMVRLLMPFIFHLTKENSMSLSTRELDRLRQIIKIAEQLIAKAEVVNVSRKESKSAAPKAKRSRRSGKELVAFRKMLKAERKRGVAVAELAKTHGISSAYIYQL
jgi:NADH:ubiquinone oxidoreductase subunit D